MTTNMKRIPNKLREEMANDPYYDRCCVTGRHKTWTKVDWHHNLIFAGSQVNEKWCILPLARSIHNRVHEPAIKQYVDWIMLNRATEEELARYSKLEDLKAKRDKLNRYYEDEKNHPVL